MISKIDNTPATREVLENEPAVSDDFIRFCQTGKYPDEVEPDIDDEVKAENQYVYDVKQRLRESLQGNDCSKLHLYDDGISCDTLDVYALIELAVELSPPPNPLDEMPFPECVLYEVLDVFESDPERMIDNQPR